MPEGSSPASYTLESGRSEQSQRKWLRIYDDERTGPPLIACTSALRITFDSPASATASGATQKSPPGAAPSKSAENTVNFRTKWVKVCSTAPGSLRQRAATGTSDRQSSPGPSLVQAVPGSSTVEASSPRGGRRRARKAPSVR